MVLNTGYSSYRVLQNTIIYQLDIEMMPYTQIYVSLVHIHSPITGYDSTMTNDAVCKTTRLKIIDKDNASCYVHYYIEKCTKKMNKVKSESFSLSLSEIERYTYIFDFFKLDNLMHVQSLI